MQTSTVTQRQKMRQRKIRLQKIRRNYKPTPLPSQLDHDRALPGAMVLSMGLAFVAIVLAQGIRKHNVPKIRPVMAEMPSQERFPTVESGIEGIDASLPPRHRAIASTNPYEVDMPDQMAASKAVSQNDGQSAREDFMARSPWQISDPTAPIEGESTPASTATPIPEDIAPSQSPEDGTNALSSEFSTAASKSDSMSDDEYLEPIAVSEVHEADSKPEPSPALVLQEPHVQRPSLEIGLPTRIEDVQDDEKKITGTGELPLMDVTRKLLGE